MASTSSRNPASKFARYFAPHILSGFIVGQAAPNDPSVGRPSLLHQEAGSVLVERVLEEAKVDMLTLYEDVVLIRTELEALRKLRLCRQKSGGFQRRT